MVTKIQTEKYLEVAAKVYRTGKKRERYKINDVSFYLKKLEQEE